MTCAQIEERLTAYVLGDLSPAERTEVEGHLAACPACRTAADELRPTLNLIRDALATPSAEAPRLDPARRAKIMAAVRGRRSRMRRIWPVVLRAAALVVILLVFAGMLMPALSPAREKARATSARAREKSLRLAANVYEADHGRLPRTAADLAGYVSESTHVTDDEVKRITLASESSAPRAPSQNVAGVAGVGSGTVRFGAPMMDVPRPSLGKRFGDFVAGIVGKEEPESEGTLACMAPAPSKPDEIQDISPPVAAGGSTAARLAPERLRHPSPRSSPPRGEEAPNAPPMASPDGDATCAPKRSTTPSPSRGEGWGEGDRKGQPRDMTVASTATAVPADDYSYSKASHEGQSQRTEPANLIAGKELACADGHASYSVDESRVVPEKEPARRGSVLRRYGGAVGGGNALRPSGGAAGSSALESKLQSGKDARFGLLGDTDGEVGDWTVKGLPGGSMTYNPAPGLVVRNGDVNGTLGRLGTDEPAEAVGERSFEATDLPVAPAVSEARERKDRGEGTPAPAESRRIAEAVAETSKSLLAGLEKEEAKAGEKANMQPQPAGQPSREAKEPAEPVVEPVYPPQVFTPLIETKQNAFSTFGIDVDTASFTLARRYLLQGKRPPEGAIRVEEFVNAFDYAYRPPERDTFAVYADRTRSPFRPGLEVLRIGVRGKVVGRDRMRPSVLTFVIDTSGSMNTPDRLDLIRKALGMLVDHLAPQDTVAIVAFGSEARLVLDRTPAAQKDAIRAALDGLQTYGSTHLEGGLRLGYEVAARNFLSGAINRVLLLSDGVANLGAATAQGILAQVERYKNQGIYCSVFGVGQGTYNDTMLETLADKGDGIYRFVDSLAEARRVFVDDLAANLCVLAKDVKIQVEFDPARVTRYRQIGYENRHLEKEQFRDDTVDAGEVGAGQSAVALYEIVVSGNPAEPLGTARLRWKDVDTGRVEERAVPLKAADRYNEFGQAPVRFRLAAGVAEFADLLRRNPNTAGTTIRDVAAVLRPVGLELSLDQQVQDLVRMVNGVRE